MRQIISADFRRETIVSSSRRLTRQGRPRASTGRTDAHRPLEVVDMTNETPTEVLLTPAEVAAMFCVEPKTVTRWAVAGKIHAVRTMGGHRRYRRSEIDTLMARLAQQPENARADQLLSEAAADHVGSQADRRQAALGVSGRATAALQQSDLSAEPPAGQPAAALDALRRASGLRSAGAADEGAADEGEGIVAAAETVEAAIAALAAKVAAAAVVFERRVAEAREALQAISAAAERAAATQELASPSTAPGQTAAAEPITDTDPDRPTSRGLASDVLARVGGTPSS
jgi:excisionase family DNA binding protein